ncbi:hypothetical protein NA56DRAFT_648545 [Hyaloscypha hepaticicola]|uniref:Uncharacterized protein n=1 Tax=Hyaloscypha hepaticicola TaxID=2082293 RepID=A0A2J6PTY4_9HELO|nr:hypothetical protein NA56DRAFT_648545 [Hyaloscypha hepaticicola]
MMFARTFTSSIRPYTITITSSRSSPLPSHFLKQQRTMATHFKLNTGATIPALGFGTTSKQQISLSYNPSKNYSTDREQDMRPAVFSQQKRDANLSEGMIRPKL